MNTTPPGPRRGSATALVIVAALGYFVDIYDLILFGMIGRPSLVGMGLGDKEAVERSFMLLHNTQMRGLLLGGILWGVYGDRRGRLSVLFGSILLYSVANLANAFVTSMPAYVAIRFVAGIGLAGELGAGITLVSEALPKGKRGYGATIVAAFGMLGAPAAYLVGHQAALAAWLGVAAWQLSYLIGGGLGLLLLLLRIGVYESGMYAGSRAQQAHQGRFDLLFRNRRWLKKYLQCIALGLPTWYAIGILIFLAPQFAEALGLSFAVDVPRAIMLAYLGLAVGDVLSGLLSQLLRSRRRAVGLFLLLCLLADYGYLLLQGPHSSPFVFYLFCFCIGLSVGYWAVFVTIASEQFGTNIRATVTTTVPNFARGALVPITLLFIFFRSGHYLGLGTLAAALIVGGICIGLALWAVRSMEETFSKDLDYLEEHLP
ncbi:MAG: MFS transporter [Sphingobacteriia bacterium]